MDEGKIDGRMAKTLQAFADDLLKIRTGRAHAGLLDQVKVPCYGQDTPLPHTSTVAVGGPRQLTVTPWDKTNLPAVEKAIRESDIGVNPVNDGSRVIVNLPELSEDRRTELVKLVKREAENARIALRNIRRDELTAMRERVKDKEMSESDLRRNEKRLQEITDRHVKAVDQKAKDKAEELMQV